MPVERLFGNLRWALLSIPRKTKWTTLRVHPEKSQLLTVGCEKYALNEARSKPEEALAQGTADYRLLSRFKNSSLVLALDLIRPSMQLVVVEAPAFWTPRMTMQRWVDSITTATPCGLRTSDIASATCFVSRS